MGRCKRAEHCGNPSWCKTTGKCLKAQPAEAPHATADLASARAVIEQCRAALSEELSAWDIDPPLHHVKEAHDACVAWLAGPNARANLPATRAQRTGDEI